MGPVAMGDWANSFSVLCRIDILRFRMPFRFRLSINQRRMEIAGAEHRDVDKQIPPVFPSFARRKI